MARPIKVKIVNDGPDILGTVLFWGAVVAGVLMLVGLVIKWILIVALGALAVAAAIFALVMLIRLIGWVARALGGNKPKALPAPLAITDQSES